MCGETYLGVEWRASMHALSDEIRFGVYLLEHDQDLYQPFASEEHAVIDRAGEAIVAGHAEIRRVQEVRGHVKRRVKHPPPDYRNSHIKDWPYRERAVYQTMPLVRFGECVLPVEILFCVSV